MSSARGSVTSRRSASSSPVNGSRSVVAVMGGWYAAVPPAGPAGGPPIDRLLRSRDMSEPLRHPALLSVSRLLDVESGEWLLDRRLLVDADGRIEAILGPDDTGPDGARPVDLPAGWAVPGLI